MQLTSQQLADTPKTLRAERLEQLKTDKRVGIVESEVINYKSQHVTTDILDPSTSREFSDTEFAAADFIYKTLIETQGSRTLDSYGWLESFNLRSNLRAAAIANGHRPFIVVDAWDKMLDQARINFDTKHLKSTGVSLGRDDESIARWR